MESTTVDLERLVVQSFRSAYPDLDALLREILRRGETQQRIMARIGPQMRLAPLLRSTVETALGFYAVHGIDAL